MLIIEETETSSLGNDGKNGKAIIECTIFPDDPTILILRDTGNIVDPTEDTGLPGNSASAWYLLADPRRLAALEVAFLDGRDRPTIEQADADFNNLGILMRGYLDFGVKEQDSRGALKMDP